MLRASLFDPAPPRLATRRSPRRSGRQMRLAEAVTAYGEVPLRPAVLPFPGLAQAPELSPEALVRATAGAMPGLESHTIEEGQPEALLTEGDVVMLLRGAEPLDGDLCALHLADASGLLFRRVYQEGPQLRLQPEDRSFPPLCRPASSVELVGRVIAIVRRPA